MLPLYLIALGILMFAGQDSDLTGTWAGDARMTGSTEMDHIILVLEKSADSYSGKLSDSRGLFKDEPIRDVTFRNNNLRFKATARSTGREIIVDFGLNYFQGRFIGGWGAGAGDFGPLDLSREKE